MLYSRFLASLLAKHKRDGAARGRMHQEGPPTQQPQASSSAPAYQQQRATAQQAPPSSHGGASPASSSFATGGNPTAVQDVPPPPSITLNGGDQTVTTQTQTGLFKDTVAVNTNEPIHQVEIPPYTFGASAGHQHIDAMDFTFDSIAIDDLLGPMKAIDNPLWMQTMMLPGCVSPALIWFRSSTHHILQILVANGRELFILWQQQHDHRWLPELYGSPTCCGAPRLSSSRRKCRAIIMTTT